MSRWLPATLPGVLLPLYALAAIVWALLGELCALALVTVASLLLLLLQARRWRLLSIWLDAPDSARPQLGKGDPGQVLFKIERCLRNDARKLESVEARLRSLRDAMDAVPDGIVILDANHQVRWSNRAAGVHLGIRLPRDSGAVIEQLVRTPGFAEYLRSPEATGPFILQSAAARSRVYAMRVVPLAEQEVHDGHDKLLLSVDVSDARRVEAMRSEFVANVSHELRTPLTVVNGFLEHFAEGGSMSADQRHHFARLMSDQTARMLSLVNDLLTLSRLESDDVPASEENVQMSELLAQLLSEAQSLSEGRHHLYLKCEGPPLRGSRKELHSAFGNLVSNAIRYTPEGGDIAIAWTVEGEGGVFAVRDSGVGIAAEHLPRLTERFYRVDRGRSRETGGTGLGLAIVKHILLRHQAQLVIESQVGSGSTFRAEFPAWRLRPEGGSQ